jgi:hypothetical protein
VIEGQGEGGVVTEFETDGAHTGASTGASWHRLHCPACGRFRGRLALTMRVGTITMELAPCPGCGQVARVTMEAGGGTTVSVVPRRPGERGTTTATDVRPGAYPHPTVPPQP